ncbi:hypothetical protein [Microbacterium sp. CFBP9034]|uniref:hypothetical protein n=1 Tax=Microbacterium sp. CFBP9034 TaxID=3096540 RepID=UPI002A6A5B75|nr:hypothetical protein [Microbacterium sp. CFBP9034]MDY0908802.1 hypothetical protein [Microbacterium sp. CFBP9034]
MRKTFLGLAVIAALAAPLALGATAHAATLDTAGKGLVGKGEVQSAFGWNNAKMQGATLIGFTFSTTQAATQSVSQDASQVVTEHGSQTVVRTLSCTVDGKNKHFEAYGTREGDRIGSREGERTGSLAGSLAGSLVSDIAYDNKGKNGQWTGFYLTKFAAGSPSFSPTGSPVWDDQATYTEPATFAGDLILGDIEWGGWQSEPGENPNDCTRTDSINGIPVVSNLHDELDETAPLTTTVEYGAESFDETSIANVGGPTGTGPVSLFVTYNGTTKPLTITPAV